MHINLNNFPMYEKDCEWGSWTQWSSCDVTCEKGYQTRARAIAKQASGLGKKCDVGIGRIGLNFKGEELSELKECHRPSCPGPEFLEPATSKGITRIINTFT